MKFKREEGKTYDLGQMPGKPMDMLPPEMPVEKTWNPNGETHTMTYGQGLSAETPSLQEMVERDMAEYYPYLPKGSPEYRRRLKEFK